MESLKARAGAIALTPEEQALLDTIVFDTHGLDYVAVQANGERVSNLDALLQDRNAIPARRLAYFTDPTLNIGGRGKSHRDIFESNGCRGEDILRHPSFLSFFRYMVLGPNLPASVIEAFAKAVSDCGSVTSGDVLPLAQKAAQLAKGSFRRPPEAAEHFYQLALDLGIDPSSARMVRDKVRSMR